MNLHSTLTIYAAELRRPLSHAPENEQTVAIDFDGPLSKADGPYFRGHFGPPNQEGLKLLGMLIGMGYHVVIFTARKETDLVATWLKQQGFSNLVVTNTKPVAIAYVDDRAISFGDNSTADEILQHIQQGAQHIVTNQIGRR